MNIVSKKIFEVVEKPEQKYIILFNRIDLINTGSDHFPTSTNKRSLLTI